MRAFECDHRRLTHKKDDFPTLGRPDQKGREGEPVSSTAREADDRALAHSPTIPIFKLRERGSKSG